MVYTDLQPLYYDQTSVTVDGSLQAKKNSSTVPGGFKHVILPPTNGATPTATSR